MGTLIAPRHGAHDIRWNRSQLVPIEFKNGPNYMKHTMDNQKTDHSINSVSIDQKYMKNDKWRVQQI